jgi:hypothetical protein
MNLEMQKVLIVTFFTDEPGNAKSPYQTLSPIIKVFPWKRERTLIKK